MTEPRPGSGPRRAARWGLVAGAGLIGVTALALLVVTLTLSNDPCEQAGRLHSEATVVGARPPEDLARTLPQQEAVTGAASADDPLDADEIARAFSNPELGRPLLDEHGFSRGLGRAWRGSDALASAWVLTFERVEGATAFARELIVLTCDHADEVFGVADVTGAIGMRLRFGDAVQDEAIFSYGSMVFVVGYTYPGDEPPDTDAAEQLARAARASVTAAAR
ncbi:MAG TPA: hypothetical protein VGB52_07590 [Actinomycetota bacterium]